MSLSALIFPRRFLVLIETYWNVNLTIDRNAGAGTFRINRNILECKFLLVVCNHVVVARINRNILECKCLSARTTGRQHRMY